MGDEQGSPKGAPRSDDQASPKGAPRSKDKAFPYADLGNLLKRWRATKYRSATALCAQASFSFSYGVYAAYERGEDLPPPAAIEEIARFLGQDPREALLAWAQVQMHTAEFKAFFSPQNFQLDRKAGAEKPKVPEIFSNQIPPSEFDNTWVFSGADREHFGKYPWMVEFLIGLAVTYPDEMTFEECGFAGTEERDIFVQKYLSGWVREERISLSETGFRLAQPHIHMPKNESWQPIRDHLLSRALEALIPQMTPERIRNKECHRTTINKVLTDEQRAYWISRLAEIELEFAMTPNVGKAYPGRRTPFTLLMLMAPRQLGLPQHIVRPKKLD